MKLLARISIFWSWLNELPVFNYYFPLVRNKVATTSQWKHISRPQPTHLFNNSPNTDCDQHDAATVKLEDDHAVGEDIYLRFQEATMRFMCYTFLTIMQQACSSLTKVLLNERISRSWFSTRYRWSLLEEWTRGCNAAEAFCFPSQVSKKRGCPFSLCDKSTSWDKHSNELAAIYWPRTSSSSQIVKDFPGLTKSTYILH